MTGPTATTRSLPYCRPRSMHSFYRTDAEILPLQWQQRGPRRAVSLVVTVLQLPVQRPASVPWELGAGPSPVPCSDCWNVSLEPVLQSRTEMLQKSALKIYLMPRNLGRTHTQQWGVRALAGADLPPIERWNRGRGQSGGEETNRLRCRSVAFAHGNALCIAKELGAVSKPALEHFIMVNLVVISPADK